MSFLSTQLIGFGANRAAPIGGIDSFTELMLHFDGTDASTTFTDSSSNGRSPTVNGDAQIDTAQSKFGGASGLFDGTGDYLQYANVSDWDVTGDLTIDFWLRTTSTASTYGLIGHGGYNSGSGGWDIRITNQTIAFNCYETTGLVRDAIISSNAITNTTDWFHVAIVRSGSDMTIYVNGTSVANDAAFSTVLTNTSTLEVGAVRHSSAGGNPAFNFNGWLDELRISKGIARWTANFTPPAGPYTAV